MLSFFSSKVSSKSNQIAYDFSFDNQEFDLAVTGGVAMGYGPGICMHKLISNTNIPDDNQMKTYLNDLINCYDQMLNNNCSSNLRYIFSGMNYWILAAGEGAKYWNEFKNQNFVSIGWEIGDLTRYKTKKAIEEKILKLILLVKEDLEMMLYVVLILQIQ